MPDVVAVTTDQYRADEDLLGRFLADCVEFTGYEEDVTYFGAVDFSLDRWRGTEGIEQTFSPKQLADALTKDGAWRASG